MKVFRVVADSSCLIGLAQINLFKLLKELFSEVYIPDVVYDEIVIKGKGEAGSEETESAVKDGWILKKSATPFSSTQNVEHSLRFNDRKGRGIVTSIQKG